MGLLGVSGSAWADGKAPLISKEQALTIVEQTPEAKAIESIYDNALATCLDKRVDRPCDTKWVTCIDNAWVVQFFVTDRCRVKTDGRLGLNIVVNDQSGQIISRYPEVDYFNDPHFCREQYECLPVAIQDSSSVACLNFVHAPFILKGDAIMPTDCTCQKNRCVIIP